VKGVMVRKIRFTIFALLIVLVMAVFVPTVDAYSIVAWGFDGGGQVSNTPIGNDFVDIAGGEGHSLALKSDGSLVAWGFDGGGQVSNTPTGTDFVDIAGGEQHSLALEDTTPIPEPSTLILFGIGILGVIGVVLRRKRCS